MKGYTNTGAVWQLRHKGEIVASLVVSDSEWPWVYARLQPRPGFGRIQPLLAEELRLLDDIENKVDEWEAAYDEIRKDLTLLYPDGNPVPEYLLHVKNDNAWWRWNDQPFPG
ncbi:MAG TPA: hypothetical protein VGG75_15180 [Trebonia sp.]